MGVFVGMSHYVQASNFAPLEINIMEYSDLSNKFAEAYSYAKTEPKGHKSGVNEIYRLGCSSRWQLVVEMICIRNSKGIIYLISSNPPSRLQK